MRTLVLAPTGRDGQNTVAILEGNGHPAHLCRTLEELNVELDKGAAALFVAEEALATRSLPDLIARLEKQEPWSDIPIVVVTTGGHLGRTRQAALDTFAPSGNVTFLERPFRKSTLLSSIRAATRSRLRQYQARDSLTAIRRGEERLRLALDAGRIAVFEWDGSTGRFACTDQLYAFTGRAKGSFGDTLEGFASSLHPDDARRFLEFMAESLATRKDLSLLARTRGGERPRHLDLRARPLTEPDGEVRRVLGTALDITDRLEGEEELRLAREELLQSQKLEAIGKLAGGIAHDFNNMLTAINGYSEILLPAVKGIPDVEAGLGEILKSGRRAAALTHQLLAYSRQQVMTLKPLDLNEATATMGGLLKRLIREDIRTDFDLDASGPLILADHGQIEQVILNLVVNARDALPKGGRIRISTRNLNIREPDARRYPNVPVGRYVALAISDDGIGMTPEVRARVFEPFFTTKEKTKGTGMGLSTVYGIVKQSNGHIWVESEPGRGTVFTLLFPEAVGKRPAPQLPEASPAPTQAAEANLMVVEDEASVRQFLVRLLEAQGYRVLAASNGEEALALEAKHRETIHLLITDVVMPGINGRDLADRISARRPGTKVLFITGYTDDSILHHGVLEEGRALLNKPFSTTALLERVAGILAGSESRAAR